MLIKLNKNSKAIMENNKGFDMIGESDTLDLSDIDLQNIKKYKEYPPENKNLCFLRENITEMNYDEGAHNCNPIGINIKYSENTYKNKHMSYLGLKYTTNKYIKRYERSHNMRTHGFDTHYTDNIYKIEKDYINVLNSCKLLS